MIEQQMERLIQAVERCEAILARILQKPLTDTWPPPQQMQMRRRQAWLEQQTPQAMQQKLPPE